MMAHSRGSSSWKQASKKASESKVTNLMLLVRRGGKVSTSTWWQGGGCSPLAPLLLLPSHLYTPCYCVSCHSVILCSTHTHPTGLYDLNQHAIASCSW